MRKLKINYVRIVICLTFCTTAIMQSYGQQELSLPEAIAIGLENNYGIRIAQKQYEIAESEDTWARAGRTPVVTIGFNLPQTFTNNNNPVSFINGLLYNTSAGLEAALQMPLYTGGRINANKRVQSLNLDASNVNFQNELIATNREIALAYNNALVIERRMILLEELISLSRERLDYEAAKDNFGRSNSFERRQLQDALYADSSNLVLQELAYDNAMRALKLAMNDTSATAYILTYELEESSLISIDEADARNRLRKSNLQLKSLSINREIADARIKLLESQLKPSLNLGAGLTFQENYAKIFADNPNTGLPFEGRFGNVATANVGITATYLLYDGQVSKTNVQNARTQREIADLAYEDLALNLSVQLENLLANFRSQKEVLAILENQIENANINLEQASERLKVGQINSLDYRAVQVAYLNTAFNKITTLSNLTQIIIEIEALLSTGE